MMIILFLFCFSIAFPQDVNQRITQIEYELEVLANTNESLNEQVKTDIGVKDINLSNLLLAISNIHGININIAPELEQIKIVNNFTNVSVSDLLIFLCKEYSLTIDFTGNILSIRKFVPKEKNVEEKIISIDYTPGNNLISLDLKNDNLYKVFKQLIDKTGKNIVFSPDLEGKNLTIYLKDTPFDTAMKKLAYANDLYSKKTKDNFFLFEAMEPREKPKNSKTSDVARAYRPSNSNFHYKILDPNSKLLEIDFINIPISDIIYEIGNELNVNIYIATPLEEAGLASFRAKTITFDELLIKIFESKKIIAFQPKEGKKTNNKSTKDSKHIKNPKNFTFKVEDDVYYFGTEDQLSVRSIEIVSLKYRSVQLLGDPIRSNGSRTVGRNINTSSQYGNFNNQIDISRSNTVSQSTNYNRNYNNRSLDRSMDYDSETENSTNLLELVPNELKGNLDFEVDYELNSFYVTGSDIEIKKFKNFINKIDKPVPVVLIEVMFIELNKSNTIDTGVSWGLGDNEAKTSGSIFPETEMTLGAKTINKIIGGFNGFGSFNLGKVVPNFFAKIKALETNGVLNILSTPKLATLNGHKATFSNGQTSYYAVTQRNIYGSDNPQTSEITNYFPVDAELGLTIKPSVSGNGQVLLNINVIQSSFGNRIAEDSPPDINSRNFNSIIRMQDQDVAILGGLEEEIKNETGSGVPFLARIPVIKWLFSKRKREGSKSKLTVLIKPTVIY